MNRPNQASNVLVILFALLMILAGAWIGARALSPTMQLSSILPNWLNVGTVEQAPTLLSANSSVALQAETPLAQTQNGSTAQDAAQTENSSREPIVIIDSTIVAQQTAEQPTPQQATVTATPTAEETEESTATNTAAPPTATLVPATPVPATPAPLSSIIVRGPLPSNLEDALSAHAAIQLAANQPVSTTAEAAPVDLLLNSNAQNAAATYRQLYVAATRFDKLELDLSWHDLGLLWRDGDERPELTFDEIAVPANMVARLETLLGPAGSAVKELSPEDEAVEVAWDEPTTLLLLPFDNLVPRLAVLAIDGQKPIENANRFDVGTYPLIVPLYLHNLATPPERADQLAQIIAQLPTTNRDPSRLTVLAMTGVTAMVRYTAKQMDELGNAWPAEVVGAELASADITHISNEVPFVADCETDTRDDNLNFCSKHEYFETLQACGVDIIGLTGNHQNDYGRQAALDSLDFYQRAGLPVYGGGVNKEAAFAPLYFEHNGNRLAFLGANSYGPEFAWATDDAPGSAQFDLNILSASIRSIHERDLADVVLTELQYQERYTVSPLIEQRVDFNALVHAGADIVTGVQSHVPQAMEFTDGRLILFGLGNLFFDQMLRQDTREGMFVKHTIYDGRHISTQIFTTLLYDAGQPRWTTDTEREALLTRVFGASYWE